VRSRSKTVVAALSITGLAVVGMDAVTYAGTGDSLILGQGNSANQTTHVKSTGNGPALSLHAKGKRPALAVDSTTKIRKLNADQVDGKGAAALQNNVRVYTDSFGSNLGSTLWRLPDFPNGRYLATYDVFLDNSSGTTANPADAHCYFIRGGTPAVYSGYTQTTSTIYSMGLSAADVINKTNADWYLECIVDNAWDIFPRLPIRVTLTRIDKAIGGTLPVVLPSAVSGRTLGR
jgi:hypothetical protein